VVEFSDVGSALGRQLGYRIAGNNVVLGVVTSSVLETVGDNLLDVVDGWIGGQSTTNAVDAAFDTFGPELVTNLKLAGVGAISSFLTAELIDLLGVEGFAGEVLNTGAGAAIGQVLTNIVGNEAIFSGVNPIMIAQAIGSFLGTKLASEVIEFDSIGGQIGAAVGSTLAVSGGIYLSITQLGIIPGLLPVAALAFVGTLIGGLIGSIFGGTPRSGADAVWDENEGRFVVANVYSKKGGSKEAAEGMAATVAETFNMVLDATGSRLAAPEAITTGNYGMRKSDFVYRPIHTRDKHAITYRVSSKDDDAFSRLTGYGIWKGMTDPDFQLIGGSNYVKRAVYATFEMGGMSATDFDQSVLAGNIASAQSYELYLANSAVINAIVAAESDSVFAAETAINLVRAVELGLTKRHRSDWFGGFNALTEEAGTNAANVEFGFDYDPFSDQVSRLIGVGNFVLGDTIDIAGQTTIEAGDGNDTITLTHQTQQITRGGNLVDMTGWPDVGDTLPTGPTTVTGWETNPYDDESEWALTTGPDGRQVVTIHSGQDDADNNGGGNYTNTFTIDETQTYEFTYYFRKDANNLGHRAIFGLSSVAVGTDAYVEYANAANFGTESTSGNFYGASGATQDALFEDGKWYKVTGYVLPEGSASVANNSLGGIFDVETGEKVANTSIYRWNANRPGDEVFARFITLEGTTNVELSTHFMAPEVRQVLTADITGGADKIADTTGLIINGMEGDGHAMTVDVAATIDAGAGNDEVHAGDLGNNVFGGDGDDTIYGGRLDDWLLGGDGDDTLHAGAEAGGTLGGDGNYLDGGADDDTLYGREGSDWLEGGAGDDVLHGGAGGDVLAGGASATSAGDELYGGAGDDSYVLRLGDGANVVSDTDTATLTDQGDADWLDSIAGNWLQAASTGGFTFAQSTGIDSENYIQSRYAAIASGTVKADWLGYFTPGVTDQGLDGGEDSIVLGQGIGIGDVRLKRSGDEQTPGDDLIIQIMGVDANGNDVATGDEMTLTDWFVDPFERIEWLKFADGNEIRIGDITTFIAGTNGNDTLVGTHGNDFLYGGDGNDRLFLLAGDDIGTGGSGKDYVAGDSGDDLMVGGSTSDAMTGGDGIDVLTGDGGDDDLYGGAGDDTISGGRGNDHLVGGAGSDIFKYSRGDGEDIVFDDFNTTNGAWETVWDRSGSGNGEFNDPLYELQTNGEITRNGVVVRRNVGTAEDPEFEWIGRWEYDSINEILRHYVEPTSGSLVQDADGTGGYRWDAATGAFVFAAANNGDVIEFAPGINIQDVVLRDKGDDLVLYITDDGGSLGIVGPGGDSITLKDWNNSAENNIERLAFFATGELDLEQTNLVAGTDGSETLDGTASGNNKSDWITGGTGDDTLRGFDGDDILSGNGGIDTIRGHAGDDVLYGGSGDDILIGGSNSLTAGAQGDILIGGEGSDWASYEDDTAGITASLEHPDINTGDATGDSYSSIENLRGSAYNDELYGDDDQNILDGGADDDVLKGRTGDDTYVWNGLASGSDIIREYTYGTSVEIVDANGTLREGFYETLQQVGSTPLPPPADGSTPIFDHIVVDKSNSAVIYRAPYNGANYPDLPEFIDTEWEPPYVQQTDGSVTGPGPDLSLDAGTDTLELGEGITFADLSFAWSGSNNNHLLITSGAKTLTIENQRNSVGGTVEILQFHEGISANLGDLRIGGHGGDSGDNLVVGASGNDTLGGGAGDDVMFGGAGGDTLTGGNGDDVVEGGAGADNLSGNANSANDGTNPNWGDTVSYQSSTGGVVEVDFTETGAQGNATGGDEEGDVLSGFENYIGSESSTDNFWGDDNDNRAIGLGGNDTLRGAGGDDVLVGGEGNDSLWGGNDDDNLSGDEGNDFLDGGAGNDLLSGGDGTDALEGEAGNDILLGGDGDDSGVIGATTYGLFGGDGDDTLDGGAGNDSLAGGQGNDTLIGGAGNDHIHGGWGDDTYVFGANDGTNTVVDSGDTDTIVFAAGLDASGQPVGDPLITRDRLWIRRWGDDLRIEVIGGTTLITVEDHYAGGTGGIEKIQTADGTLFLDEPEAVKLLDKMQDGFVVGGNHVDLSGWPTDSGNLPTDGAPIDGFLTNYLGETEWGSTEGPYGSEIVALHAGDLDQNAGGGGAISKAFTIDGAKNYKFTLWFKNDGPSSQEIWFGTGHSTPEPYVINANDGSDENDPYFVKLSTQQQDTLVAGRWYRIEGLVFSENAQPSTGYNPGGVYDSVTGEKVFDTDAFIWNGDRPNDSLTSRFFMGGAATQTGLNSWFAAPEVYELGNAADGDSMPLSVLSELEYAWSLTETPAPQAHREPLLVEIDTITANAVNMDQWPDLPPSGKSEINLVEDDNWPGDVGSVPTGVAQVSGWPTVYTEETSWDGQTDGPYGHEVVSMKARQSDDTDDDGGGSRTNSFTIDYQKTYEFTYYFRKDDAPGQRVLFGLSTVPSGTDAYVKNAVTGNEETNPLFHSVSVTTEESIFESAKWYKVVGYVFAQGPNIADADEFGGVYDTETGEKVAGVTNFRWNGSRPDNSVYSRFLTKDGESTPNHGVNFYRPEVREVTNPYYMMHDGDTLNRRIDSILVGGAAPEGWENVHGHALDGEARWVEVTGPDGQPMVVVEAGQFDSSGTQVEPGGGNHTNDITIDPTRTYRYVQYFRKSDLTRHSIFGGIWADGDTGGGKELLTTGAASDNGLFLNMHAATQTSTLVEDEWYMVVGYVLPENTTLDPNADYGGIYRVSDETKVASVNSYRWASNSTTITAHGRFLTYYDETDHGWTTQFGAPSIGAIVNSELAAYEADPFRVPTELFREAVTIQAATGVTDLDANITDWSVNPDGAPTKGEIVSINATTGEVQYRPYADATGEDNFSVVATDAEGNQTVVPIRAVMTLVNVNRAPDVPTLGYSFRIDENSAVDTIAGTLSATDPDGDTGIDFMFGDSLMTQVGGAFVTYSDDDRFRIERDTGKVKLNQGSLDHEAGDGFAYEVRVTDKNSGHNSRAAYANMTIEVRDVNEQHALDDATIAVNHYSRALGPFVPMPGENGFAINLYAAMLDDVDNSEIEWEVVTVNGASPDNHPWSVDADGTLHLIGDMAVSSSVPIDYTLVIEAYDPELDITKTATLTLDVGTQVGVDPPPAIAPFFNFNFNFLPPVVLDLDGDGLELVGFNQSTARFDMDGDGNRDRTGWVGADDGLLAIDLDGDGIVNDGSEISFQRFVEGAFSDLEGLAFFDTNLNGAIDAGDARFGEFRIWRDTNQDGVSDAGEVFTLTDLGIESISLTATLTGQSPGGTDNVIYATGSYRLGDGSERQIGDTFLVFDPLSHLSDDDLPEPDGGGSDDAGEDDDAGGDDDGLPELEFARLTFDRKAKKFRAHAVGGELVVGPKNLEGAFDPRAGQSGGAAVLAFSNRSGGYLTPIILDLDGDGVETRKVKKSRAWFDMDGNGSRDNVGWAGEGDGFLVIDRNDNGLVDNGAELSFLTEDPDAATSLQALASLDSNGDGRITADDDRFGELRVWVDRNDNGRTDQGELRSLADHGISAIGLAVQAAEGRAKIGSNLLLGTTVFTRENGSTGTAGDVALAFEPGAADGSSLAERWFAARNGTLQLPEAAGSMLDAETLARIEALASDANGQSLKSLWAEALAEHFDFDVAAGAMRATWDKEETMGQVAQIHETVLRKIQDLGTQDAIGAEADGIDPMATRVALMLQDMNSFGASGAGELQRRNGFAAANALDYYAA
jgi:Ca2+-binding RTX toxin-like protein